MKNHFRPRIVPMRFIAAVLAALAASAALYIYMRFNIIHVDYQAMVPAESAQKLDNPCRGWYCLYGYRLYGSHMTNSENLASKLELETARDPSDNRLVLIEINLAAFRASRIDEQGLSQIDTILSAWESCGKSIILRFLYDWDGCAVQTEPDSIDIIMEHMRQSSAVVNRHASAIYTLQGLFTGNCGEMTGSRYMSSEDIQQLASCLASYTDSSIKLSVRTPAQWRTIMQSADASADSGHRFGLFNDGITGSVYDLGTYSDRTVVSDYTSRWTRADELDFQNILCRYAPNGGEAVIDNIYNDYPDVINDLNTMGISYLNSMHDSAVLDKWKSVIFHSDDVYDGMSVYDYIGLHLGYRYLVTGCRLEDASLQDRLHGIRTLAVSIQNTGFAGCYSDFDLKLTLYDSSNHAAAVLSPDDFDMCRLTGYATGDASGTYGNSADVTFTFDATALTEGTYTAVLSCSDRATGETIYFSNEAGQRDGSVMLGRIYIAQKKPL